MYVVVILYVYAGAPNSPKHRLNQQGNSALIDLEVQSDIIRALGIDAFVFMWAATMKSSLNGHV